MRFFILFVLGLCKVMSVRSDCEGRIFTRNLEPMCGISANCYQHASNLASLEYYSCKRMEKGLPGFRFSRGECPSDKPPC